MSHPLIGHDYSEKSADESKKEYKKRRATALGFALKNKAEGKKLKVQSSQHGETRMKYNPIHKKLTESMKTSSDKIFSGSSKSGRELKKTMAKFNK